MRHAGLGILSLVFTLFIAIVVSSPLANAQVTTTGIHGIVRDSSGSVIPRADIKLVDTATGLEKQAISSDDGSFVFANLQSGSYRLTASAAGFQIAVYSKVIVDTGRITDQPIDMKVGAATETVEVAASALQLATTTNEVGATITNNSVTNVPLAGRETLNFALLMPGVGNAAGNDRNSTFNGLPNASMDITVDGMNNNSQRWKSGGTSFYEFAPSRIDAIEQVTVSTTGLGADAGGQGAMQIRMTTKRGTDQYHFKVLEQLTNEDLNANSYFNNLQGIPRPKRRQNNEVGSFSGPLVPFVPSLKHKLFFFAYFEAQPQPSSSTVTTNLLTAASQAGDFTYNGTDGKLHNVNLLSVAGAGGFTSTIDPTVAGIFAKINGTQSRALIFQPVAGSPYLTSMVWSLNTFTNQQYPTARLDYQISSRLGWHGTWNLRHSAFDTCNPTCPSYPEPIYYWSGASTITTYVASNQLDWTITPHLLNNLTVGIQSNLEAFNPGGSVHQWASQGDRIINLPLVSNYIPGNVPEVRNNPVFDVVNNLTWVRGRHSFTMGGSFRHAPYYDRYDARPLAYTFGVASSDTVSSTLLAGLPAINQSNSDFNNALSLYAGLTGRLTGVSGTYSVDEKSHQYVPFAPLVYRYNFNTGGLYVQDSYRIKPSLTLNFGLRNQFDGPVSISNGVDAYPTPSSFFGPSTRLFHPGELNGNIDPVYGPVKNPYRSDLLNLAPTFGFAWNPTGGSGLLGKLMGDHKTVIRSSYGISFYNEGSNAISFMLEANKGSTQTLNASAGSVGFPVGQINLSSTQQPTLSVAPATFGFPMSMTPYVLNGGQSLNYADPNLRSPYVQNWVFGIQRGLPGNVVLQVNYVGNKSTHMWHYQNVSELNIFESGFLTEFQNAQNNLAVANGISLSQLPTATLTVRNFANTGKPGQVPTPMLDAAFGANGTNAALATASGYGSSGFITNLQQGAAASFAGTLASTSTPTYYCRLVGSNFTPCAAQGYTTKTAYPMNIFYPNPYATTLRYQNDNGNTNYNGLQVEGRKSLNHGLFFDLAYTWSHALGTEQNASDTQGTYTWYTLRNGHLNYGPIPFDHRHTFTSFWTYDVPVGKGRLLDLHNRVLDSVIGGWTLGGIEKIISGGPSIMGGGRATVNNLSTAGVTFGNGFDKQQLKDRLSSPVSGYDASCTCFHTNVSDIVQANGSPNPAYYGPGSTAGQYSVITYLYGKTTFQLDMNLNKDFNITERLKVGINFQTFNVLNHPFLNLGNTGVTSTTFGNITGASGSRSSQIRGYVSW